jgi:hypothetical protein
MIHEGIQQQSPSSLSSLSLSHSVYLNLSITQTSTPILTLSRWLNVGQPTSPTVRKIPFFSGKHIPSYWIQKEHDGELRLMRTQPWTQWQTCNSRGSVAISGPGSKMQRSMIKASCTNQDYQKIIWIYLGINKNGIQELSDYWYPDP